MCAHVCAGMHAWMWVLVYVSVCAGACGVKKGSSHLDLDLHAVWISWCRCGSQTQILYKSSQLYLLPSHFSTPTPIYCFFFLSFSCLKCLFNDSTLSLVWAACCFPDCFKAVCIYPAQATFKWHSSTSRVAWGLLVFVLEFSCLFLCVTETRDSLVWSIQLSFRMISSHEDGSLSYWCVYCGGGGGAHFYA